MEPEVLQHLGILSILPPVVTIVLAFIFKDVILALLFGIFSATILVTGGDPFSALCLLADKITESVNDLGHIHIILFGLLLGGFVSTLGKTGAVKAFGEWAARGLKTRTTTLLATFVFGLIIFIDDYFNALAVGTVMRPVSDRMKISRAKLAYVIDATAAPVCIMAPISTWIVSIMSIIASAQGFENLGVTDFGLFIRMIPYNYYAWTTLLMVVMVVILNRDFGPMKNSEQKALNDEGLCDEKRYGEVPAPMENMPDTKARAFDMVVAFFMLITSAVVAFPLTTWFGAIGTEVGGTQITTFAQAYAAISISNAFAQANASAALFYAVVFTLVFLYIYLWCRRLIHVKEITPALSTGMRMMLPAMTILVLAWTIGTTIKSAPADGGVGLSFYLKSLVLTYNPPFFLLPLSAFVASCVIAFSTGTSYGTMGIMIPITLPIALAMAEAEGITTGPEQLHIVCFALAAVLGGAVYGDHASPISDTTILCSTGAACPVLEHFTTQFWYATFVAICTGIGYLIGSFCGASLLVGWIVTLVCFAAALSVIASRCQKNA